MLWLGIGILVLGTALLILSIVLIKPLFKLAGVLGSIQKTTEILPKQVEDLSNQAKDVMATGVGTLHQINQQVEKVSPLLNIIGDVGRATNKLSSSIANKVNGVKSNGEEGSTPLNGFYGLVALIYLLFKRK